MIATAGAGLAAHLLVVTVWVLAALTLLGLGSLLRGVWGATMTSWRDFSLSFWLGMGVAIGLLQVWHLVLPVNGWAVALLGSLGGLGMWRARGKWWRATPGFDVRLAGIVALVLLWIANRALGPTALFDTGMYHQPSVWWTNSYPLIPGLGNLHGRLAFNATSLLFSAPFDTGPLDGAAVHLVNSLLAAVLVLEGACAWQASRRSTHPRAFDLFSLAILPNVLHGVVRQDVRSLSTDAAVCAVLFVAVRLLFDALAHPPREPLDRGRGAAALILLFTTAVTVKLSAAMVAATGVAVGLWTLWPLVAAGDRGAGGRVALWLGPPLVLFGVWVVRGVLLSGYPLYPADLLPLPVDWRVPAEQIAGEEAWITMSARNLNSNVIYAGTSWILPWLRGVIVRGDPFVQLTLPLALAAGFGGFIWASAHRARHTSPLWSPTWVRAIWPLGTGVVFWLASAPHTRMAQGLLWSVAAMVLAYWASRGVTRSAQSPASRLLRVVLVVTGALLAKQAGGAWLRAEPGRRAAAFVDALITRPSDGVWMSRLPVPELVPVRWTEQVALWAPVQDNRCWNTGALCTPHPSPGLRLRRAGGDAVASGALRHGFRSSGEAWEPRDWPNPWTPFLAWWRCVPRDGTGGAAVEERCLAAVNAPPSSRREPPRSP